MLTQSAKNSFLFVYTVPGRNGFWVRAWPATNTLLRLLMTDEQVWLVRTQAYLPPGAAGFCAVFSPAARRRIERTLRKAGQQARFHSSLESCEQAEQRLSGQGYVFGLSAPAGQIPWLTGPDPWPGSDEDPEQRSRPSS